MDWNMTKGFEIAPNLQRELEKIGLIDRKDVLDGTVVRVPKAYPAYFGEYREISASKAARSGAAIWLRCPRLTTRRGKAPTSATTR